MNNNFKEMSMEEKIEYLSKLTNEQKLELMTEFGAWAEPTVDRAVAHYIILCNELEELYGELTDNGMSYNSYSPKNDVIPAFNHHNMKRSSIACVLEDFEEIHKEDKEALLKELLTWLHKETDAFK